MGFLTFEKGSEKDPAGSAFIYSECTKDSGKGRIYTRYITHNPKDFISKHWIVKVPKEELEQRVRSIYEAKQVVMEDLKSMAPEGCPPPYDLEARIIFSCDFITNSKDDFYGLEDDVVNTGSYGSPQLCIEATRLGIRVYEFLVKVKIAETGSLNFLSQGFEEIFRDKSPHEETVSDREESSERGILSKEELKNDYLSQMIGARGSNNLKDFREIRSKLYERIDDNNSKQLVMPVAKALCSKIWNAPQGTSPKAIEIYIEMISAGMQGNVQWFKQLEGVLEGLESE